MGIDIYNLTNHFYVMNYILSFPNTTNKSFFVERRFKKTLWDLKDIFDEYCEDTARILRDYLAMVCLGEFRYAKSEATVYNKNCFSPNSSREEAYCYGVDYDPDNFLPIIEKCFRYFWWKKSIGGTNWANIAKAAQLYEKVPHVVYIDHVVDLFHNNNSCFDKPFIFNYCSCFLNYLNYKKEAKELLTEDYESMLNSTCQTHRIYIEEIEKILIKMCDLNPKIRYFLRTKRGNTDFPSWKGLIEEHKVQWRKKYKVNFNLEEWKVKTNFAYETLQVLSKGATPDITSEFTEQLNNKEAGDYNFFRVNGFFKPKKKKSYNIITDKFNTSVFIGQKKSFGFKIGDYAYAKQNTAYPETWEDFLDSCPSQIVKINAIEPYAYDTSIIGYGGYDEESKHYYFFLEEDLEIVNPPKPNSDADQYFKIKVAKKKKKSSKPKKVETKEEGGANEYIYIR